MNDCLYRRMAAEALGSCILLATVVGSGIMADRLSTDPAVALLCNTLPTGAILFVLITVMGPISGAHFNPAVTLAFGLRREIAVKPATLYVLMQLGGRHTRNMACPCHVRHAVVAAFRQGPGRAVTVDFRGRRNFWARFYDSCRAACQSRCGSDAGGRLYIRCLLVYSIHFFRQPCCCTCPGIYRYLLWNTVA